MKILNPFRTHLSSWVKFSSFVLTLLISSSIYSQNNEDKIEAPFFEIEVNGKKATLPLLRTDVEVDVVGVIADVKIKQVFVNNNDFPLDANYVFPGSSKSAVYKMKMQIEDRTIIAQIKEKEEAKKEFEQAKQEGKGATLLEQHRPNVFEMGVANIPKHDTIVVEFAYTELLIPEKGTYEFVFPTVVGPRYGDSTKDSWIKNPFANTGTGADESIKSKYKTEYGFKIKVNLNTGIPLSQVTSTSHEVNISYQNLAQANITLKAEEKVTAPKDFVIQFQLQGKEIQNGLLLYEGEKENFFLYMAQPPARIIPDKIPPREYVFILDVSGSMNGFPIEITKELMKNLLGKVRPSDKFNVLLFAGTAAMFADESVPANGKNIKDAFDFINRQEGSGGTELLPALEKALDLPNIDDVSRTIVIATDGFVTVEQEAFDLIRENLGKANFFAFGIGPSVNHYIIEGMAHVGNGEPFTVSGNSNAEEVANRFADYIQNPVLTNVKVKFEGFKAYDVEPSTFPDLFAEKPIVLFGKWKGKKEGNIVLEGYTGGGKFRSSTDVLKASVTPSNEALKYLWARKKIQLLSDYNSLREEEKYKKEITALGLEYNLLTKFTSFLGIDSKVQDTTNKPVNQPLVSNPGAVPEPHEWALIFLVSLMAMYFIYIKYFKVSY